MQPLHPPAATYRLQFNQNFGFNNARRITPYLNRLGITELYASPLFQAREGSSHGYDVVDPTHLDPQLGSEHEFRLMADGLKSAGLGLLLDIVPNHMAASSQNPWWMDVLENGRCSPWSGFFDINWNHKELENRLLLPFLGSDPETALQDGEFDLEMTDKGLFLCYHELQFPLDIRSYRLVLSAISEPAPTRPGGVTKPSADFLNIIHKMADLPPVTNLSPGDERAYGQRQAVKQEFLSLASGFPDTGPAIRDTMKPSFAGWNMERAGQLLSEQVYRLRFWKTGLEAINYRRFFDISELIGLRTEDRKVFDTTHRLVLELAAKGDITGIRIDHIDGLIDPQTYLSRIQSALEENTAATAIRPFYTIVEKILTGDEQLPPDWATFGTTGYDFLDALNRVFIDPEGVRRIQSYYNEFVSERNKFADIVYEKKKQVMRELFTAEVTKLTRDLLALPGMCSREAAIEEASVSMAIMEVSACLPVYRTYITAKRFSESDRQYLQQAVNEALERNTGPSLQSVDLLESVLFLQYPEESNEAEQREWINWVMNWQQFTGPVMAKGFEDTSLYHYNFLVSLNEVGGNPGREILATDFHRHNLTAQLNRPYTTNASSTHDTKRSEDVRSRINVLSEYPQEWGTRVNRWRARNADKKHNVDGRSVPQPAMEMLIYQTLIGAWPLDSREIHDFEDRFKAYLVKAAREAKVRSHWHKPNAEYEQALQDFAGAILADTSPAGFLADFTDFQQQAAFYGAINSLGQVLLKIAAPGIPDFYRGTELWDFSLVDPDNRRPVDFQHRQVLLDGLIARSGDNAGLIDELLASWTDGRIKMFVTHRALQARRETPDLFCCGEYLPIHGVGERALNVFAFARKWEDRWAVVAVPRIVSQFTNQKEWPIGGQTWGEDFLVLPPSIDSDAVNVFTGENITVDSGSGKLMLAEVFARFPVSLVLSPEI